MGKNPKISCVMCAYNTKESYLREAIESILNQTYKDFELIIVDDGSTEPHVKQTIQSYQDTRVKYFYKENQGKIGLARNFGNEKATGEYIAILDSDDIATPDRFQKEVEFLDSHPDYFCVGGLCETFPVKEILDSPSYPCLFDCLMTNPVKHGSAMFRRADMIKYHLSYGIKLQVGEDYFFWVRALMNGLKIYNFREIFYLYRREGQGIMTTEKEASIQRDNDFVQNEVMNFLVGENQYWKKFLRASLQESSRYVIYLWKLPLMKIKVKGTTKRYYLFNFLPILKIEQKI